MSSSGSSVAAQAKAAAEAAVAADTRGDKRHAALLYRQAAALLRRSAPLYPDPTPCLTAALSYESRASALDPQASQPPSYAAAMAAPNTFSNPGMMHAPAAPAYYSGAAAPSHSYAPAPAPAPALSPSSGAGSAQQSLSLSTHVPKKGEMPQDAATFERAAGLAYTQAREQHELGRFRQANKLYQKAAELFLHASRFFAGTDKSRELSLRSKAELAISAAEALSRALQNAREDDDEPRQSAPVRAPAQPQPQSQPSSAARPSAPVSGDVPDLPSAPLHSLDSVDPSPLSPEPQGGGGGGASSKLTAEEVKVLEFTSHINGRTYLPWHAADLGEKFHAGDGEGKAFRDPDGFLKLSPKQQAVFARWARPQEIFKEVKMIYLISSSALRQTVVSDCSFVSSLAISADYERKFKKRIITNCIFPQNSKGEPIVSPSGKYMIRLHFNGVWRKIIIDDALPVDASNQLLCSHSNNNGELWVSLMEKAYLKIMGGYDFPGSNSAVDLHALSGWIPERLSLANFDPALHWPQLWQGLFVGNVLITVATGNISDADAERAGLVPTHAYALTDMRDIEGLRLVKLKNPWNRLRWRGNYSPNDDVHWTPKLLKALNYDLDTAKQVDNGEFWIDWKSLQQFFDVMYMNWNPALFAHKFTLHDIWQHTEGPVKDAYNMEHNPQYSLEVEGNEEASVWVLLSRHITHLDDFADNKEYITVHTYKGGSHVLYPDDPFIQGVKINSPHFLTKFKALPGSRKFTLVVSQYEKATTIRYSLKVYSSAPIKVQKIRPVFKNEVMEVGKWTAETAGGCPNDPVSHKKNSQYEVKVSSNSKIRVKLQGPRQYSVGLLVRKGGETLIHSDSYRSGFCYMDFDAEANTTYTVIPATFDKGQEGPFFLTASSPAPVSLKKL